MTKNTNRLYKDLAWLWPLWETLDIYRKESKEIIRLIKKYSKIKARTLLDIGCGGGKNASQFKKHFRVTGIDISKQMLRNARKLNPECKFIIADMRNFDLKKQFDSVFINDAHNYMTTQSDLLKVFKIVYKHLKPGGVMVIHPDQIKSTFKQNSTHIWRSKRGDIDITFIENDYDPNPKDSTFESTFVFLIRKKGKLRIEHDYHTGGIFTLNTWRKLLKQAGFEVYEEKDEMTPGVPSFICFKSE